MKNLRICLKRDLENRGRAAGIYTRLALGGLLLCLAAAALAAEPGGPQMRVAVWSVLVDAPLARSLQEKEKAPAGKTDFYQGSVMDAKTLRAMLRDGRATSHVLCIPPRPMTWLENSAPGLGHKVLAPGFTSMVMDGKLCGTRLYFFDLPPFYMLTAGERQARIEWRGNVRVEIQDRSPSPQGGAGQPDRLNRTRPPAPLNGALDCEGELKAGEALVCLAALAQAGDAATAADAPRQLIAVEAVEAGAAEAPKLAEVGDLARWLEEGPEGALQAIHEGRIWVTPTPAWMQAAPRVRSAEETTFTLPANSPWRKTLPNGVTVELAGIGMGDGPSAPWRRADGTTTTMPETARLQYSFRSGIIVNDRPAPTPNPDPNRRAVCLIARYDGNKDGLQPFSSNNLKFENSPGASAGYSALGPQFTGVMALLNYSALQTSQTLRLGVAAGPWKVVDTYRPGTTPVTKKDGDAVFTFSAPATDRGFRVAVRHNQGGDGRLYRLAAILKDGKTNARFGSETNPRPGGFSSSPWVTVTANFRLPPDQVTEFQLQASEYQWVEFPVPAFAAVQAGAPAAADAGSQSGPAAPRRRTVWGYEGPATDIPISPPLLRWLAWTGPDWDKTAWHPDGSPVADPAEQASLKSLTNTANDPAGQFDGFPSLMLFFENRGRMPKASGLDVSVLGPGGRPVAHGGMNESMFHIMPADPRGDGEPMEMSSLALREVEGEYPARADLRVRYSGGPWYHAATVDAGFRDPVALDEATKLEPANPAGGLPGFTLTRDESKKQEKWIDVQAVTGDGFSAMRRSAVTTTTARGRSTTYRFEIPGRLRSAVTTTTTRGRSTSYQFDATGGRIAEYQVQYRFLHETVIKDVVIRPQTPSKSGGTAAPARLPSGGRPTGSPQKQ